MAFYSYPDDQSFQWGWLSEKGAVLESIILLPPTQNTVYFMKNNPYFASHTLTNPIFYEQLYYTIFLKVNEYWTSTNLRLLQNAAVAESSRKRNSSKTK